MIILVEIEDGVIALKSMVTWSLFIPPVSAGSNSIS
jgi:hypothetical protein